MVKSNIIIFILLCLLLSGVGYFFQYKNTQESIYTQNLSGLNDTIKRWKNKYGSEVAGKSAILLHSKNLSKELEKITNKNLDITRQLKAFESKKPKTIIITKTETLIDTLSIVIQSGGEFSVTNEYYHIKGVVKDTLRIQRISFTNFQSVVFGYKKRGWFKPSLLTAQITNTNPYVKTDEMKVFSTIVPVKRFHMGVQVGVGISTNLQAGGYIGIGVTYSLFSF